jgi:exonuclease SbcD
MKIFHLADLHIGKTIYGCSLLTEQRQIFGQLLGYVVSEQPDAVLLCGDIYDKSTPGADAVALYDYLLTALAETKTPVFIIGGNHDSPERLAFGGRIMQDSGIYIYSIFAGTPRQICLRDKFGRVDFYLLPFLRPAIVRPFFPDRTIDSYTAAWEAVLSSCQPDGAVRNILLAHQFVVASAAEPARSDSETEIGGINGIDAGLFSAFDYVALGHIHGPQSIGRPTVRYAGSPLKYSFSEVRQNKAVTVVELGVKGDLEISALPLTSARDLRKIAGPLECLLSQEVVAAGNPEDYLQVTLTDERDTPYALERLRLCYPNVLQINRERRSLSEPDVQAAAAEHKNNRELLAEFFHKQNGRPLTEGQAALAFTVLREEEEES